MADSLLPVRECSRRDPQSSFQMAKAYYYKAAVEEIKLKQPIEAFTDYLNALWIVEGLKGERSVLFTDRHNPDYEYFTALVYRRLAWFLYNYDAWDTSLECLERSSECFMKNGSSKGMASNLELMGDVMLAQGDRVQSLVYYQKSDSIHVRLKSEDVCQNFSSVFHRALDLYNANEKEAALALLRHALADSEDERLCRKVRFSLGYYFLQNKEYDSALYHYERSYPLLPRQTLKSYCAIVQVSNILGDSIKAARYGNLLASAYQKQFARSGDRTKMIMLFETYKQDSVRMRQKDVLFVILCIAALLFVLLGIVSILFVRRRRRHKEEIEARERIRAALEGEIEEAKSDSKQKSEQIKALESKLEKTLSNPDFQTLPFDKKLETLYEVPMCKRILRVKEANVKAFNDYPELKLSDNQLTMLVNAVDAVFPKFSVRIIEMFPRLKRYDVQYCCLYILGITEVQAAALTGKTYQAVWTRSLKLHEIFNNKSSLQIVLHGILKDW
jgi:predicted negative regulator of RcsB-dependent stress response